MGFPGRNDTVVNNHDKSLHEWLIFMGFHVGKYTSPMDGMGVVNNYSITRWWQLKGFLFSLTIFGVS